MAFDATPDTKAVRRVRRRRLPSGWLHPCTHEVRFCWGSPLARAALETADAMHVRWVWTHGDMVAFVVDSLGVAWLREAVS